jgi:hypothetical protein
MNPQIKMEIKIYLAMLSETKRCDTFKEHFEKKRSRRHNKIVMHKQKTEEKVDKTHSLLLISSFS